MTGRCVAAAPVSAVHRERRRLRLLVAGADRARGPVVGGGGGGRRQLGAAAGQLPGDGATQWRPTDRAADTAVPAARQGTASGREGAEAG